MLLNNLTLVETNELLSLKVKGNGIAQVSAGEIVDSDDITINFKNAIVFPGLINSHDHLNFNLFPQLGDKIYSNYVEWGNYINSNYKDEIQAVLKVPDDVRTQWGIYKNLVCGVTTVLNHGEPVKVADAPITVFNNCQNLHSVQFEKHWNLRLNNPLKKNVPVAIHVAESNDASCSYEADQLNKWNLLRRDIIGVHGVAMNENQAAYFKALVWCPQSNFFLLNKTARISVLKSHIPILFGTDSTLSSHWDIWDHIRLARQTAMLTDDELYNSLTLSPAKKWRLNCGAIAVDKEADLVIARKNEDVKGIESFFNTQPQDILIVMHQGKISLVDEEVALRTDKLKETLNGYSRLSINGAVKYVRGNLTALIQTIYQYYPKADIPVKPLTNYFK